MLKLNRLARSVLDAHSIADELAARGVTLALGQSRYDPVDPMCKMFFNILATFVEFEVDLIRRRTVRAGICPFKRPTPGQTAKAVRQAAKGAESHAWNRSIHDQRPGGIVFHLSSNRLSDSRTHHQGLTGHFAPTRSEFVFAKEVVSALSWKGSQMIYLQRAPFSSGFYKADALRNGRLQT